MKKLATIVACGAFISLHAQTTFFTENFGTGCSQGQVADGFNPSGVGTWTVTNTGSNDAYANFWYISSTESGMGVGNCGDGCLATGPDNRTLHLGPNPFIGDLGAAYLSGAGMANTNKRAESPAISCVGFNSINLSFNYLMGGVVTDYCDVYYSSDGGITWSLLATPPQTANASCAPQGIWTSYGVTLPASANNNANVKIGFRWQNSGSSGSDPSVAIDDVVLSGTAGGGPTITTGTISGSPFCAGLSLIVPYTVIGTFTAGNIFTAELSDGAGSFASPTNIGTLASITSGNILCAIPAGTVTGAGYMIRVVSSTPIVTGTTSAPFTINALPMATSGNTGPYCEGQTIILSAAGGGASYGWVGPLSFTASSQNPNIPSSTVAMSGDYTVTVTSSAGCTSTSSTTVSVLDCSGIENQELNQTSLYPNPVTNNFTISMHENIINKCSIVMVNMVGETVYSITPSHQQLTLNKEALGLKSGIYLVKINYMNSNKVIKLVVN